MRPIEKVKGLGDPFDLALLGEYNARKNRGRGEVLERLDQTAILIDCVGVDALASEVTITCGVRPSSSPGGALLQQFPADTIFAPAVRGIVEWGNDGVETIAEFDFLAGTVLSLSAGSLRVKAQLEADTVIDEAFVRPNVVAHLGYYPRGGQNAQRTRATAALAENESEQIAIPPFARSVQVVGNSTAAGGPLRELLVSGLFGPGTPLAHVLSSAGTFEIPLPQGARLIDVTNRGETTEEIRLIFRLWL